MSSSSGSDGSVTFSTDLDNKQLEKKLSQTKKEIEKLERSIQGKEMKKDPLAEQWERLQQQIRAAREEAERYRAAWASGALGADQKQVAALEEARQLAQEQEKIADKIKQMDASLLPAYEKLENMQDEAGWLERQLAEAEKSASKMAPAIQRAEDYLEKFSGRVKGLAKRVLVFSVITAALRSMRSWMGQVVQSNREATDSLAKLKGALLTLMQPLVGVIIPAFTLFVQVLTRVVSALAWALSALFGKTLGQSREAAKALNQETEALKGVGTAAEKASGALAGFDELNVLPDEEMGAGGQLNAPSFDFDASGTEGQMQNILGLVELIGAALAYLVLPKSLKKGLKTVAGLFLAINGGVGLVQEAMNGWQNGVDWPTLWGMLLRTSELVLGLFLVFGKAGAAAGAVAAGFVGIATAFHDANKNGWNLKNTLLAIGGILSAGAGIALFAGSWVPLLLAGFAAILLAITTTFGGGAELLAGAQTMLQGFLDFFAGVFSGNMERMLLGIQEMFSGLKTVCGAIINSIKNLLVRFLTWLDQKTKGQFHGIIEYVKNLMVGGCDLAIERVGAAVQFIQDVFAGLIKFITGVFTGDWKMAWEGIKDIFKTAWNGVVGLLELACNMIIDGINLTIRKIVDGLNSLIRNINRISSKVGIPSISSIPHYQFERMEIPRLAQGAVIPPNREFLAVLGDQRSGTNIEAPLDTITEAFRAVMAQAGSLGGQGDIILQIDGKTFARLIGPYNSAESRRKGTKLVLGGV